MTAAEGAPRIEREQPTSGEQTISTARPRPSPATTMRHTRASDSRKRPVVAVDVDEVLGRFVLQLCAFHNGTYGTSLTPEDFSCYNFHEVWGGTREQADSKMRMFFSSFYFLEGNSGRGIPIIEGAAEVLRKNSQRFELHVVTSRQHAIGEHTRAWIDAYYPGIFEELHFGNHFSDQGEVRSKSDLCHSIGAVAIIDDNLNYATECAAAGFRTFLFGDYAWNRTCTPLPENMRRTVDWAELDEALDLIASENQRHQQQGSPLAAAVAGAASACDSEPVVVGKRNSCCLESSSINTNTTNANTTNANTANSNASSGGGGGVNAVAPPSAPSAPPALPMNVVADRHHHHEGRGGGGGVARSASARERSGSQQSAIVVDGVLSCA